MGVLASAVPSGLFMGGSKELKRHVADSVLGEILANVRASFPAATGATTVSNLLFALTNPGLWGMTCTVVFVVCTVFVKYGSNVLPKAFPPGTEVIIATAMATLYSMHFDYQGAVVGEIPVLDSNAGTTLLDGRIRLPIELQDLRSLVQDVPLVERFGNSWVMLVVSATLFAAVNFLSIMGITSGFESENNIPWSAPRELMAQGVSCGVAALVGSAPISGSLSRSLVNRMTGATSQMACLFNAMFWICLLPYMSIMTPTPKAALGAVIVSAVVKGVVVPTDLLKLQGLDSVIGWSTGVVTALTSPTIGFGAGLIFYSSLSVFRTQDPKKKQA